MYTLKIDALLRTFRAFGQSGTLYVEPLQKHIEEPWEAYLQLQQGVVSSCYVQRQDDKQILWQDTNAVKWLETKEGLFWSLENTSRLEPLPFPPRAPSSEHAPQLNSESTSGETMQPSKPDEGLLSGEKSNGHHTQDIPLLLVPQRAYLIIAEETLATLSRDNKRIFALIDGQRTDQQIATLLHYPPQHVVQILYQLEKKGLVKL